MIPKSVFGFLWELADDNDRNWFNANKDRYWERSLHRSLPLSRRWPARVCD